jgi:hypothetical protein
MTSPLRLGLGSYLSLSLRLPPEVSGGSFSEFRCKGRVVHEQSMKDGTFGYGVEMERTEPTLRQAYLEDLSCARLRGEGYSVPEIRGGKFPEVSRSTRKPFGPPEYPFDFLGQCA